jgi:hypothetical protein
MRKSECCFCIATNDALAVQLRTKTGDKKISFEEEYKKFLTLQKINFDERFVFG